MTYKIIIKKRAKKFIDDLPKPDRQRLSDAIQNLPYGDDIKPLKGHQNEGFMRLRVGKYRIVYVVDHGKLIVLVIDADSRGQIYKRY